MIPDTWVPTSTVVMASSVPVAVTVLLTDPVSAFAVLMSILSIATFLGRRMKAADTSATRISAIIMIVLFFMILCFIVSIYKVIGFPR